MDGIQEDLGTRLHFFATAVKTVEHFKYQPRPITPFSISTIFQIKLSLILLPIMFVQLFGGGGGGGEGRTKYPAYETMQLCIWLTGESNNASHQCGLGSDPSVHTV